MFSIILIVGAVVGGLVLLVMLYVMCRSCKSQAQREQDIEDNRHRLRSYNDQVAQVQKLPQRRPHMHLITEGARPPNRRPGQRGHEDSLLSEARNSGKRPLLHKAAIMKHIHPSCNSDREAIHFSNERDKKYGTEVNHVFRINPNEFIEARENREMVRNNVDWLLLIRDVQLRFTNQLYPVNTGNVRRSRVENLRYMRMRYICKDRKNFVFEHFTRGLREGGDVCHIQKIRLSSPHSKVRPSLSFVEKISKSFRYCWLLCVLLALCTMTLYFITLLYSRCRETRKGFQRTENRSRHNQRK